MCRVLIALMATLIILTAVGCGKPEDPFIGKWAFDEDASRKSLEVDGRVQAEKEAAEKAAKAGIPVKPVEDREVKSGVNFLLGFLIKGDPKLEFKADKTFTRQFADDKLSSGVWTLNGVTLEFTDSTDKTTSKAVIRGGKLFVNFAGQFKDLAIVFKPAS